jgi:hypothetical protein
MEEIIERKREDYNILDEYFINKGQKLIKALILDIFNFLLLINSR